MEKKTYMAPMTDQIGMENADLIMASILDPTADSQSIETTDDLFEGEFQTRIEDLLGIPNNMPF